MAGRRQPTELVKAKGKKHMTKAEEDARRRSEVNAAMNKAVRAPKWLPEELRPEFNDISKRLIKLGIFCKLDRDTLGRYLVAHQAWVSVSRYAIEAIGKRDSEGAAEWSAIQDKYFKQCRACAGDLGLSISSRCQLVIPQAPEEDDDDLAKLLAFPPSRVGSG